MAFYPFATLTTLPVTEIGPSGDTTGATDTANLQTALTAAGFILLKSGLFWINQTLLFSSATWLEGAGMGVTTIKAINSFAATQVGANPGMVMLATVGNTAKNHITISSFTLDMNEQNIASVPGYATGNQCAPVGFQNVTGLTVDRIETLNAIGYSIYPTACVDVKIRGCRVITGQSSSGYNQQDGIHLDDCSHASITGNVIDCGTNAAVGDDAIALRGVSTGCLDVAITGNAVKVTPQHALRISLSGANVSVVAFTGNTCYESDGGAVLMDAPGSGTATAITIAGNSFFNISNGDGVQAQNFAGLMINGNNFNNLTGGLDQMMNLFSGADLSVTGNTVANCHTASGILVGSNGGGVTGSATVTGNVIDLTAGAGPAQGIYVRDTPDVTIGGNTVLGTTAASSVGIQIEGDTVAPLGLAVAGNRIKGWATGIKEVNGGTQPDFNTITGNDVNGCTAGVTISGTHTVVSATVPAAVQSFIAGTSSAASAPVLTALGAVSGTAIQLSDLTRDYMVYLEVTTAGTATSLTAGHTNSANDVSILTSVSVAVGDLFAFRLPAGWWFKWTGTTTAIGNQNAVGC